MELRWCRVSLSVPTMKPLGTRLWARPRLLAVWTAGRSLNGMVSQNDIGHTTSLTSQGSNEIGNLVAALRLSVTHKERAMQVYRLAMNVNFIQGRTTREVAAVCLYIACRRDSECRMMLIDFSDLLKVFCHFPPKKWFLLKSQR